MKTFFSPSFLRYVLPAFLVVVAAGVWLSGALAHPGLDGGWIYHYQSFVSGMLALMAGFFVIVATHMSLVAGEKEQRVKAEIYWNRYKLELEGFVDVMVDELAFESHDQANACAEILAVFDENFPSALFDIEHFQYLSPDKRTLMGAAYSLYWQVEALRKRKVWRDAQHAADAMPQAVLVLGKLLVLLERHLKNDGRAAMAFAAFSSK